MHNVLYTVHRTYYLTIRVAMWNYWWKQKIELDIITSRYTTNRYIYIYIKSYRKFGK